MQLTDFPKIEKYKYERYTLKMNYRCFLRMISECCESSYMSGAIPRGIAVSVAQLDILQLENKSGVALNYDLFDEKGKSLLLSVGIVLQCPEEEQEKILAQPRFDLLMLLSILENGKASSKHCAEEAVSIMKKNLVPISEEFFPELRTHEVLKN
jgi:hypothetical protein